ncbi:MAG: hypothetical protein QM660_13340 [Dysgonomonas sp.]
MIKLSKTESLENNDLELPFQYGKIVEDEENRLKIAADADQVNLLLYLANCLNPPYYILYVLVVSRLSNKLGRYQSPLFETKDELTAFLYEFKSYLETDARHHLWIGTIDNSGLLVYDQHNVIYAYGNLDSYKLILNKNGYTEKPFDFPVPHVHNYHQENDIFEEKILNTLDWQIFPLDEERDLY